MIYSLTSLPDRVSHQMSPSSYTPDYRWTSMAVKFGPFHYSITLFLGTTLLSVALHFFVINLIATFLYGAYLYYCHKRHYGPLEMIQYLWLRQVYHFIWIIRHDE